jgi:hypothetical protein
MFRNPIDNFQKLHRALEDVANVELEIESCLQQSGRHFEHYYL